MNPRYLVMTAAAGLLAIIGCSSGGGYNSYSGGSYDSGAYGAATASSAPAAATAAGDSGSLGADIHSVVHEEKKDERIFKAEKTEPILDTSGFKSLPIDTPAKQKVISGLTPLSFNRLGHHDKIRYWFPDPYYCKCVYVGDDLAYQRYKQAKKERKKEKREEAFLVDSENQVDMPMNSEWDPVSAFGEP